MIYRFLRLFLFTTICSASINLLGCATDSSHYHYEISAYQIGEKPVHVIYRPNLDEFYSRISKGYAESGITELSLSVNNMGKVVKLEIVKSSGYSRLDTSAMALAYRMIFEQVSPDDGHLRSIKLFVNFHRQNIIPPVKVTNVTSGVELLTGFQYRVIVGAVANPDGYMESIYTIDGYQKNPLNEEAGGYASRYILEAYPESQRVEKQDLRLQITFNY